VFKSPLTYSSSQRVQVKVVLLNHAVQGAPMHGDNVTANTIFDAVEVPLRHRLFCVI
jgi:hypothetical protein